MSSLVLALQELALQVVDAAYGTLLLATCSKCRRLVLRLEDLPETWPFWGANGDLREQYVCSCGGEVYKE